MEHSRMNALFFMLTAPKGMDELWSVSGGKQSKKNLTVSNFRHHNAPIFQTVFTTDCMVVRGN
jgi:hypothetical protein